MFELAFSPFLTFKLCSGVLQGVEGRTCKKRKERSEKRWKFLEGFRGFVFFDIQNSFNLEELKNCIEE